MDVPYAEFSDPQSLNLYSYVRNIPTVKVDPDGHWPTLLAPIVPVAEEVGKDVVIVIGAEPVILIVTAAKTASFIQEMVNPQSVGESDADESAAINQSSKERAAQNGGVDPQQAPEPAAAAAGGNKKGGGRNAQKQNQDRQQSAKDKLSQVKKERDGTQEQSQQDRAG